MYQWILEFPQRGKLRLKKARSSAGTIRDHWSWAVDIPEHAIHLFREADKMDGQSHKYTSGFITVQGKHSDMATGYKQFRHGLQKIELNRRGTPQYKWWASLHLWVSFSGAISIGWHSGGWAEFIHMLHLWRVWQHTASRHQRDWNDFKQLQTSWNWIKIHCLTKSIYQSYSIRTTCHW